MKRCSPRCGHRPAVLRQELLKLLADLLTRRPAPLLIQEVPQVDVQFATMTQGDGRVAFHVPAPVQETWSTQGMGAKGSQRPDAGSWRDREPALGAGCHQFAEV